MTAAGLAPLCSSHAHLAAADMRTKLSGLQGGGRGLLEHLVPLDGGEPEAVSIGVVIAGPAAMALDEGRTSELLQAGPG